MSSNICVSVDGQIMEIRMDRPDKKNALDRPMFGAMARALDEAQANPAIRVVLITGGDDTFTAGADLHDFLENPPLQPGNEVHAFLRAISTAEKIVVAAVSGLAVGIGTTMLLHCDLVVAGKSARFSLPFVDRALVPEAASSLLLPRLVGRRLASEHLLLCDPFDAETALRYGLVNRVVDDAVAVETAREMARRVTAKPADAVRITKGLIVGGSESVAERMLEEFRLFSAQLKSPEFAQAVRDFFGKGSPR